MSPSMVSVSKSALSTARTVSFDSAFSTASCERPPPIELSSSSSSDSLSAASVSESLELELELESSSLPQAEATIANAKNKASKRKNALLDFIYSPSGYVFFGTRTCVATRKLVPN